MTISPVTDARRLNLPSIFGADKPFMPFSRMKPRIAPPSSFAHTMKTSAIGAFEIHVFAPDNRNPPSADRARDHRSRIGDMVGLGQAEASDRRARGRWREIFPWLLFSV